MKRFGKLRPADYVPGGAFRRRFGKLRPVGRTSLGREGGDKG